MSRGLRILLHGVGALAVAFAGYLLAIAIMALVPLGGPYGATWIFTIEIALMLMLPILGVILYLMFAIPRRPATPNSTPHTDARASAALDQRPSARAGERGR